MRQPNFVVGALLVVLCLNAGSVIAQEAPGRIPGSALSSPGVPSEKDQAYVVEYINYYVKQLQSGDRDLIANARERLIEPYNQGGTPSFVSYYDQTLASRIGDGLQAKDVMGRMNTLIVVQRVRHARVTDVIKAGLKEKSQAIAYAAAVAARTFVENAPAAARLPMRAALVEALKKQTSGFVLEHLYVALAEIPDPAGWEAALTKLNDRLKLLTADPEIGVGAEAAGIRRLSERIIEAKLSGDKVPDKTLNLLALVSVRYMDFAKAAENDVHKQLLAQGNVNVRWVAKTFREGGAQIPDIPSIENKDPLERELFIREWMKLMKAPPFNFKDEDIGTMPTSAP